MKNLSHLQLFLFVLVLGLLAGPKAIDAIQRIYPDTASSQAQVVVAGPQPPGPGFEPNKTEAGQAEKNAYTDLELEAKSVFVWDIKTHRKLYGVHEYTQLPLASVAKMMTAIVASLALSEDSEITVEPRHLKEEGDSGLLAHEVWKFSDLLQLTLMASSNDGASAIAERAGALLSKDASSMPSRYTQEFIEQMNAKGAGIGLLNTHFENESGLDLDLSTSGTYGSARDMAILFEYIYKKRPEIFLSTAQRSLSFTSESGVTHQIANTNAAVERIPGIIGSKTGFTDLAGGNLVVLFDVGIDHPVVIVVLGSTQEGRFTDVEKLVDATIKTIVRQ
ncbi:MAG: hypothetical protein Q8P49_01110 [Candidatus Liptonbacteria bacterium]|nr:hypothetical protein [Candidatus Liptonbacteria bacterium]